MKFIFLLLLILGMATSVTATYRWRVSDNPAPVASAVDQVNQYRTFMYVANQFMKTYSGGPASLYWSDIRNSAGAPSGTVAGGMPTSWKIVVAADTTWVACTQMDERAAGMLQQMSAPSGLTLNPTKIQSTEYIVIGQATDIPKSAQCN
jgi:hypothetical protein